jgi:hypothetical protein
VGGPSRPPGWVLNRRTTVVTCSRPPPARGPAQLTLTLCLFSVPIGFDADDWDGSVLVLYERNRRRKGVPYCITLRYYTSIQTDAVASGEIDRDCVIEHPAHPGWRHRPRTVGPSRLALPMPGGSSSRLGQISAGGPVRITAAATEAGQPPRRADHLATVGVALGRRSALRTPHLPSHQGINGDDERVLGLVIHQPSARVAMAIEPFAHRRHLVSNSAEPIFTFQ